MQQLSAQRRISGLAAEQSRVQEFKEELVRRGDHWAAEKESLERELSECRSSLKTALARVDKAAELENRAVQELREIRCKCNG